MNEKTRCQMIAINVNNLIKTTEIRDNHIMVGALDRNKEHRMHKMDLVNVNIDCKNPHNLQSTYLEENK